MKKRMTLQLKAETAIKKAVKEVIENHRKSGRPLAAWKDGKTVMISANKIK